MIVKTCNWSNWDLPILQKLCNSQEKPNWLDLEMYAFW